MLKAIKRLLNKIKKQDQTPGVIWELETPYVNY